MFELSPITAGSIFIAIFLILMFLGMPVGFAMGLVGFAGFAYLISSGAGFVKLGLTPFTTVSSYDFAVIPLFMFMALLVFSAGLGKDLFDFASKWMGRLRGGLAMATTAACAIFAAVSASSVATAATLGLVSIPEMKKYGYDVKLATGCVAAGGTMGVLIPPSAALILYGIITEESIGRLFAAGLIPGILEAVFYIILIFIMCQLNPRLGPAGPRSTLKAKVQSFGRIWEIIMLIALVLGGLLVGWFTATEAGAVGAFGAILVSMFRKRLSWQSFKRACVDTSESCGMLYGLLIGAFLLNYFLAVTTIPYQLSEWVNGLQVNRYGVLVAIYLVYLILGCFISAIAMVLLVIPIFFPLILSLGFDPIWFGIITVRWTEVAAITPPVGINVYVIAGIAKDVPMTSIFKGVIPFIVADLLHITLLTCVPQVTLWLPNLLFGK